MPFNNGKESSDRTTTNAIYRIAVGPVVMKRHGSFRPYAYATVGASWFRTHTMVTAECDESCKGDARWRVFADWTNYSQSTFSWNAGGGALVPVGRHIAVAS